MADGLEPELRAVLAILGIPSTSQLGGEGLADCLRERKTAYAAELAARVRQDADMAMRAAKAFRTAVEQLEGLA